MIIEEYNFKFDPHFNILRIGQRGLRRFLNKLVYFSLIGISLAGLVWLVYALTGDHSLRFFYFSLLIDLFLVYLWQRAEEKIPRIGLPGKGEKIEVWNFFDDQVAAAFERAWLLAFEKRHQYVQPIHLFFAFLKNKDFDRVLKRLDCQLAEVKHKTKGVLNLPEIAKGSPTSVLRISPNLEKIFSRAYNYCLENGFAQINSLNILWSMAQEENLVRLIFDEFGISQEEIEQASLWANLEKRIEAWNKSFGWRSLLKPKGQINRALTAAATPYLNRVGRDLTLTARNGGFGIIIDRYKEIEQVFNLMISGQPGVVLVGPPGVGKKSIAYKIAQMMVEESVPKFMQDKRLVSLDLGSILSNSETNRGEESMKRVIAEVNRARNVILFVEDIDNLIGLKGHEAGLDFSEILAEALDKKAFYLIATATSNNYANKIEAGNLNRVLSPIKIKTPDKDSLLEILAANVYNIEKKVRVVFSVDALNQIIYLADRYLYGQALTAKAIDLMKEAVPFVISKKGRDCLIEDKDLAELVSHKTDIPLTQVKEVEKERLLNLEKIIHLRMINQEKAVGAVASALRRGRLRLGEEKKPIANFLFVGPTGVGKTELAKTLAHVYFGSEKRTIRLDMSEYQEKKSISRMIGAQTETGIIKGYLTEAVKRNPHCLILLDEIEKAHPDILNLFLQVMDDGRLTDASNETINFTNSIIIATSNSGTKFIQEQISLKKTYDEIETDLRQNVLLNDFRPEFLNRFDKIVLFSPLSMENMIQISQLMIDRIKQKMEEEKGIQLEVDLEAIKELAVAGYDPNYGARPLGRVIQAKVIDVLAIMFLEDRIQKRDRVIMHRGDDFEVIKAKQI